jgi:hypothetical protein
MPLTPDGRLEALKLADGTASKAVLAVTNAPGVWGNASGDPMFDSYMFAPDGSNIVLTLTGLEPGRYHFYLYGHADADVSGEQNSLFTIHSGTNRFGPAAAAGTAIWQASQGWREGAQFIVFRDVPVSLDDPVTIEVAPGVGGIAVINGLQILSRGTAPPRLTRAEASGASAASTNLLFREIRYNGRISINEALFAVTVDVESRNTNELSALLFEGDVALLAPKLPENWRIVNQGRSYILFAGAPGHHQLELELAAKIQRAEPWDQIAFTGPPAAIATVTAQASAPDTELQLQSGTTLPGSSKAPVQGVLGGDRLLALRWQSKTTEVTRQSVVTVNSKITAQVSPAAVRYTAQFQYEVLQGRVSQLRFVLPRDQTLTRIEGEAVRDWRQTSENGQPILTVQLIHPMEQATTLVITAEQSLASLPFDLDLGLPQPLDIQRENGSLSVAAEDVQLRLGTLTGLRQVNAGENEAAAFRFSTRPASLRAQLTRVEPVISVAAQVHVLLEESRLLIRHEMTLNAAKAGIYNLEATPQPNLTVTDVKGDGVDEWKVANGRLTVSFSHRLLGDRKLAVTLEQALTNTPSEFPVWPLHVSGASKETVVIGAGSSPGIQLKTAAVDRAREIPASSLPDRRDELLAFRSERGDWAVALRAERLMPRVIAEAFNLVTIGDGLVGGSATVRFAIFNQGVQQFRVRLPGHWRNVEFTGLNLRRKDQQGDTWTVSLQDKAWGGYTLVVTYDYAFDPRQAALNLAGAHAPDAERESGALAVTTAAGLAVAGSPPVEPLRAIDPSQLAETDRALITRPILLAYRYEGSDFGLTLNVTRHDEVPVLDAVADRTQLTSVLTDSGEMLTQASFMVKNSERQFQRFQLPAGAVLWGVAVNGEPIKADRDGDWLLVSLPRGANQDQAFAVDIKYAQQIGRLGRLFPHNAALVAPKTDVPGTYAEWELFVPVSKRIAGFGGNMAVAAGTMYGVRDAWEEFTRAYRSLWHEYGAEVVVGGGILAFVVALVVWGRRRGFQGIVGVLGLFCILAILAGMLLPALSKAKAKAQRIKSVNNLKNIGLAARIYAGEHDGKLPKTFEEMLPELSTDKLLFDPETGERYSYAGAGKSESEPTAILAYSSEKAGRREVVMGDGSVQQVTASGFAALLAQEAAVAKKDGAAPAAAIMAPAVAQRYGLKPPAELGLAAPATAPAPAALPPPPHAVTAAANALTGLGTGNPTAIGIRSLKIEVPRSGRAIQFTRVLNLSDEPPTVRFFSMSAKAFTVAQMAFQLTAFLVGLGLVWFQWRQVQPRALLVAVGLALALIGTGSLFLAWRALGLALIVGVPTLVLIGIIYTLRYGREPGAAEGPATASAPPLAPLPPATIGLLLLLPFLNGRLESAEAGSLFRPPETPPVSVVSATYTGSVHDRVAELESTIELLSSRTNTSIGLFGKEVAVQEFTPATGDARLVRDGENLTVLLPEQGRAAIKMKLLVKVSDGSGRQRLEFGIPPALGSRFDLLLDETDAEVEFPTAVFVRRTSEEKHTRVEGILGATDRLLLSWTPRLKRASDTSTTTFVQQSDLVTLSAGAVQIQSIFEYQVSQGELRQVRVALPAGQRLLRISGDAVRSWDFIETNRNELGIELIKGVPNPIRLTIETESSLDQLPSTVRVLLPRPLDTKRLTGVVALRAGDDLGLSIERASGLDRVELTEIVGSFRGENSNLQSAWRFLRPDFDLQVKAEALQPRLEAVVRTHFTVGLDQVAMDSQVDYNISRAGAFTVRLALPADARLEKVICPAMQTWNERSENGERLLEVAFRQRTLGPMGLRLELARTLTNLPPSLVLDAVHPLGTEKQSEFISLSSEPGVGLKTTSVTGLAEISAASLPGAQDPADRFGAPGPGWLAFKTLANPSQQSVRWQLAVATEAIESWVRAEIANYVSVGETLLTGRAVIRYDVQNAPSKEFQLKVPDTWQHVEITGHGIRRTDHTNDQWRVELQGRVRGEYRLTVHWEQARPPGTNEVVVTGVEAQNVERETGVLSFYAQAPLQLAPGKTTNDLARIDARERPDWAQEQSGNSSAPVLTYRYLRPGWRLEINVERFKDAALLQALIENARLRTVVADDGQLMTRMDLAVKNNGRQHLEITLPPGAKVWSAFVAGQPVRPTQDRDHLLLPLEASSGEQGIAVELTYVSSAHFPRAGGSVELASPRLDVPLKDAHWELYLPPEYEYDKFGGSMSYERADLAPISQDFTLAEYKRQEAAKEASFEAEAVDFIRQARNDIASGTYNNQSVNRLNYFNSRALQNDAAARELKQLEEDVSRNQGSNLLRGQQNLSAANSARFGMPPSNYLIPQQKQAAEVEAKVAEQQARQLQKAQAVAVTRVGPLHVNLPTRGLRHSFVQVLQTEVNQPLTVTLRAANDRQMGWLKTLVLCAGGFVALWIAAALLLSYRPQSAV